MRYVGTRASETNPLRSIPFLRPAAALWRPTVWTGDAAPLPVMPPSDAARVLANAEAQLLEVQRLYAGARRGIGEANASHTTALIVNGRVAMPAQPYTAERRRQRRADAFRLFNKRRGELARARKAVDAARAALGMPSLAVIEERETVRQIVRASKRRPVCRVCQVELPL